MTELLFRTDPYLTEASARVVVHTQEGGVVLDRTLFYATAGGQPGDSGRIAWDGRVLPIATAVKAGDDKIALVPSEPVALPPVGAIVVQHLDWARRHKLMRMHTALHLLSVIIPLPVTGGAIAEERSRLDFDMPEAPEDRDTLQEHLNLLVDRDLPVTDEWITDDALRANPGLVKTMSAMPPLGSGHVRLVRIGQGRDQVDLQPCGGTHVARTGEIGRLRLGKVEKKGRQNRRVYLHLDS
ncbi:Ala-tRNA(Pro) hydrolase [Roseovarius marisflavi]|uniref:Alanine--tRNA ligase n=1 Tax=Roseovarius marisflavi TaxID=1054996 RepID=A0A1M7BVJ0_9RHOB|nr:alanyl-tRNA editing protein [Roseovarius marisflavi]SHL59058.1 Ala-tRNA(Pro) hydrolase [Roseovarius marisflavi]